jgi:hypothetical protein
MVVFLRKNLVLAMMALVLLAGPTGWMAQSAMAAPVVHTYQSAPQYWRCPPPPYDC